jgi:hypothetical protein
VARHRKASSRFNTASPGVDARAVDDSGRDLRCSVDQLAIVVGVSV